YGDALAVRIDHEDHVWQAVGLPQATEHALELFELVLEADGLLLRQLLELAGLFATLEVFHAAQPGQDRGEVGQGAAHPTLVDEGHAGARGFLGDRVLGLLLGADEQHRLAFGCLLSDEDHRLVEASYGLLQVNNVDPIALSEDERPHTGIPAAS